MKLHLIGAIQRHIRSERAPMHVPGHKGERSKNPVLASFISLESDLTELEGLDNLHRPTNSIAQAQRDVSTLCHAAHTHFLVNGTTAGILAAVVACCAPGTVLLASRASHVCVFNGAAMAGCVVGVIEPAVDEDFAVALPLSGEQVSRALAEASQQQRTVSAVLLTSPTYHGICGDVAAVAHACRAHRVPLIVDEAHGAHFGLAEGLPASAMQCGADVAVQSAHKTLGALTQAALLHTSAALPARLRGRIAKQLAVVQSSSPSYLLMGSLEVAVQGAAAVPGALDEPLRAASQLRRGLRACGLPLLACDTPRCTDPLRVTCSTARIGMSGWSLSAALEDRGVYAELAGRSHITFALGLGSKTTHANLVLEEVGAVVANGAGARAECGSPRKRVQQPRALRRSQQGAVYVDLNGMLNADDTPVSAANAVGRRSAALVSVYPPGVPQLVYGETISQAALDELADAVAQGARLSGCSDSLSDIRVLC